MTRISCDKGFETRAGDYRKSNGEYVSVEGTVVTCSRCGHSEFAFGTHAASEKRCLAELNENCPEGENNYYEVMG